MHVLWFHPKVICNWTFFYPPAFKISLDFCSFATVFLDLGFSLFTLLEFFMLPPWGLTL